MHFYYAAMLFIQIAGPIVMSVLRLIGIGVITYGGINVAMDTGKDYIFNNFAALPIEVQQILGLAKVDVAINIMVAGITARMLLSGYNKVSGSRKKLTTFTA